MFWGFLFMGCRKACRCLHDQAFITFFQYVANIKKLSLGHARPPPRIYLIGGYYIHPQVVYFARQFANFEKYRVIKSVQAKVSTIVSAREVGANLGVDEPVSNEFWK
ncbi:hypothetical protein D3C79_967190 [compost metagenome]